RPSSIAQAIFCRSQERLEDRPTSFLSPRGSDQAAIPRTLNRQRALLKHKRDNAAQAGKLRTRFQIRRRKKSAKGIYVPVRTRARKPASATDSAFRRSSCLLAECGGVTMCSKCGRAGAPAETIARLPDRRRRWSAQRQKLENGAARFEDEVPV